MPTKHKATIIKPYWYLLAKMVWPGMSKSLTCSGKPGDQGGWTTGNCDVPMNEMSSWWDFYIPSVLTDGHKPASWIMFIKSLSIKQITHPQCVFKGKEALLVSRDQMVMQHHSMYPQSKSESQGKSETWVTGSKYGGGLNFSTWLLTIQCTHPLSLLDCKN